MAQASAQAARRRWTYAPLAIIVLLALAWSAFWFYAVNRAEATLAAWMERQAAAGRLFACEGRTIGGFPFRIELRCARPRAEVQAGDRTVVLEATSLFAAAEVFQPDLVVVELTGPMTIATGRGGAPLTADWRLLQASLRGFLRGFERLSVSINEPALRTARAAGAAPLVQARHVEAHARLRSGSADAQPVFDLVARAEAAVVAGAAALAQKPFDAEAEAVVHGVRDLSPVPLATRLRQWQADGGRLEIVKARVAQGEIVAVAKGELGLTPQARLDGGLQVTLAGLAEIGGWLFGQDSQAQASMLNGLAILAGRAELEGKPAVVVPLRFRDGAVFFGPLPLGQTPPLY